MVAIGLEAASAELAGRSEVMAYLYATHGPCRFGRRPRVQERHEALSRSIVFQQLAGSAARAIWLRVNILVAVPIVWISNPFTMGPMYYFCYLLGVEMLGQEQQGFDFELSFDWLITGLSAIWQPFLLGCFTVGVISALASFALVRIFWHLHILNHIKLRARRLHNRRRHHQVHGK